MFVFTIYCSPKLLVEGGRSLPEVSCVFLFVDSYIFYCSPILFTILLNRWLKEEGLSQRFPATFFSVDRYTFHCSPIQFTPLLNRWLKEDSLSQGVPAIFLLVDSYTVYCSYTFYCLPIRGIALLYCVLISYTFHCFGNRICGAVFSWIAHFPHIALSAFLN